MEKPYHLMTDAERLAARIATNRAIEERVKQSAAAPKSTREPQARKTSAAEFAKIGHAFLDSLPDMEKGTEAARLLKLAGAKKPK